MNELLNAAKNSLTELSAAVVLMNILISFALCMVIAWVYRQTHRSISYSRSYVQAMIMLGVLAAVAMMILGNNLTRALGVLGVFTLIRFRTIVKDAKDATFLFFALAIGMAVGTNNYAIAIISTFALSTIVYGLDWFDFGSRVANDMLLTFAGGPKVSSEALDAVFAKYTKHITLLQMKTGVEQDRVFYYRVRLLKPEQSVAFLNALHVVDGVQTVDLVTGRDAAEY